jgi:hypothetical protein
MKTILRWALILVTVAGLAIDFWVHWDVAHDYVGVPSPSFITQFGLFKFEAVLALVTALLLIARPNRLTAGLSAAVGLGGAAALLVYYEYDPGKILGILPDMADKTWYPSPEKGTSVVAELIAGVTALALIPLLPKKSSVAEALHLRRSTVSAR